MTDRTVIDEHGNVIEGPEPGDEDVSKKLGDQAAGSMVKVDTVGAVAAVARESEEIKAAILQAKAYPRDVVQAEKRIRQACRRLSFAKKAAYSYPRGGKKVSGPSVYLARELATCWGNIRSGVKVIAKTDEAIHIKGWCLDAETNTYFEAEDSFKPLIQRKGEDGQTRWVRPDERDLFELTNRHGAKALRSAILQALPADIVEEALGEARATIMKKRDAADPKRAAAKMLAAFEEVSVTEEMLETWLGHELTLMTDAQNAELFGIYNSIKEGNSKREEYFTIPEAKKGREKGAVPKPKKGKAKEQKPPSKEEPEDAGDPPSEEPDAHIFG